MQTLSPPGLTGSARRAIPVLFAVLVTLTLHLAAGGATAAGPSLAIDAGIGGNQATNVGTIENCISVKKDTQFQMDIVIQNVSNLLAWETYLDYDPSIVTVVGQNAKLFQQANAGSSVLDLSGKVPDDSGFHYLAAFDSSDPPTPDSGSGVLVRVTLKAVGAGDSKIRFGSRDLNEDGVLDKGTLLRDVNGQVIGDLNGDTFFDGEQTGADVAVDQDCPAGRTVAPSPASLDTGGGAQAWLIGGGAAAALAAVGGTGAVLFVSRRRSRSRRRGEAAVATPDAPGEPS
jgi:hypothetical protein